VFEYTTNFTIENKTCSPIHTAAIVKRIWLAIIKGARWSFLNKRNYKLFFIWQAIVRGRSVSTEGLFCLTKAQDRDVYLKPLTIV
jgi:hypothetical protein